MDGSKDRKKKQKQSPIAYIYLPPEIIEIILFHLPVKSLLRFKSVCKQWKATISDPKFHQTHLRLSNNNYSVVPRPLLKQAHNGPTDIIAKLVCFDRGLIRHLSPDYLPMPECSRAPALCYCDGLLLLRGMEANNLFLWNPSSRAYRVLHHRHPRVDRRFWKFGICYDPSVENYKVVLASPNRYTVFHCRTNSWGETKETKTNNARDCSGVSCNGFIYWIHYTKGGGERGDRCEIVRFDGRDDKFKCPWKVDTTKVPDACLTCSRGALYVFPHFNVPNNKRKDDNILILKKFCGREEEPWTEIKVLLQLSFPSFKPLCWISENQLLLRVCWAKKFLLYDDSKGSFSVVKDKLDIISCALFPHMENMFLL